MLQFTLTLRPLVAGALVLFSVTTSCAEPQATAKRAPQSRLPQPVRTPMAWGEPQEGLALGILVDEGEHALQYEVFLKNFGKEPIVVGRRVTELPKFLLHHDGTRWLFEANPGTFRAKDQHAHRPDGGFRYIGATLAPGAVLRWWSFVVPIPLQPPRIYKDGRGSVTAATFKVSIARSDRPNRIVNTVTLTSNKARLPYGQRRRAERDRLASQSVLMELLIKQPETPLAQVLFEIARKQSHSRDLRVYAAHGLAKMRSRQAVDYLMELCGSRDEPLLKSFVFQLGRSRDPRGKALLVQLAEHKEMSVRAHAVAGLGWIKASDQVPLLAERLKNDSHHPVRENAARAIGQIGNKEGLPALHEALNDDVHNVRYNVVLAIGRFRDLSSVEPLVKLAQRVPGHTLVVVKTIEEITGKDFDGDLDNVIKWLDENRDDKP